MSDQYKNSLPEELHPFIGELPERKVKKLVQLWAASDPLPDWKTKKTGERIVINPWAYGDQQGVGDGARYREWLLHELRTYPSDLQRAFIRAVISDAKYRWDSEKNEWSDDMNENAAAYDDIIEELEAYLRGGDDGLIYGERLVKVTRQALDELGALDMEDGRLKYNQRGGKAATKAKAVFRELWEKEWFGNKTPHGARVQFADLMTKEFKFEIGPKAFEKKNNGEDDERRKIEELIPKKKHSNM